MNKATKLDTQIQATTEEVDIIRSSDEILAAIGLNYATVRGMKPGEKRASYQAVINWLTEYQVNSNVSNLEKVKGLLETFFHLYGVLDWEKGNKILFIQLNTPTKEELHWQLQTWGFYTEQINLYKRLLGKLNSSLDVIFLRGLGMAYECLAEYSKAFEHYQQSLSIAIPNRLRQLKK